MVVEKQQRRSWLLSPEDLPLPGLNFKHKYLPITNILHATSLFTVSVDRICICIVSGAE